MRIYSLLLLLSSPAWAQAITKKPTSSPTSLPRTTTARPLTLSPTLLPRTTTARPLTLSPTRFTTARPLTLSPTRFTTARPLTPSPTSSPIRTTKPVTISPTRPKPTKSPTVQILGKPPTKSPTLAPTTGNVTRITSPTDVTVNKPKSVDTSHAPTTPAPTFPSIGPNAFGFTDFDLTKYSAFVFTPHQHPGWPAPHLHLEIETHGMSHDGVPVYPVWPPGTFPQLFDDVYEPHVHPDFPDVVMMHPTADPHGHSHEGILSYYFLTGAQYLPSPVTMSPTPPPTANSTPPTLAPSSAPQYWMSPPDGLLSEQSCEQLKWTTRGAVCGTSLIKGQCPPKMSYPDAAALCAGLGARLCRSAELGTDITAWSGCSDDTRVWAADTCSPPASSTSSLSVNWTSSLAAAWRALSPGGPGENSSDLRADDPNSPMAISQGGSSESLANWDLRCSPVNSLFSPRCCADASTDQEASAATTAPGLNMSAFASQSTCELLKWPLIPLSSTACSYGRATADICSPSVVFATAKQMCEEPGARLCTSAEISDVVNLGDDCAPVSALGSWLPYWTNEPCGLGYQHVLRPLASGWAVQCEPYSNRARVRCCADIIGVSANTCAQLGWPLIPVNLTTFKTFATCFAPLKNTVVQNASLTVRPQCPAMGTQDQNENRCGQIGSRLCSRLDLPPLFTLPSVPGCNGTGGNGLLWTSDSTCPGDQVSAIGVGGNVTCFNNSVNLPMYCCADAVSANSMLREVHTMSPTLVPSMSPTLSPTTPWPTTAYPTSPPVTKTPTSAPRPVTRPVRTPPTAAPTTVRSAQSCNALGWIRQGAICARTWRCDGVNFDTANNICLIESGRLCLIEELAQAASSCIGNTSSPLLPRWTQSPCPIDGFVRVQIPGGSQCVPVDSEFTAAVVCCADLLAAAPGQALTANPTPAPTTILPPTTPPPITDTAISWTFIGSPENLVPDGPNLPRSVQLCATLEWPPLQAKDIFSNSSDSSSEPELTNNSSVPDFTNSSHVPDLTNSSSDLANSSSSPLIAVQSNNTCSYWACCNGDGGCQGDALSQPDAAASCAAVGARLCTATELGSGNFTGKECMNEASGSTSPSARPNGALTGSAPSETLWTSSLCTDSAWAQAAGEDVFPQCYPKTYRYKFRCCADA